MVKCGISLPVVPPNGIIKIITYQTDSPAPNARQLVVPMMLCQASQNNNNNSLIYNTKVTQYLNLENTLSGGSFALY